MLLCKPGKREQILTLIEDLGFGSRINVEELSKTLNFAKLSSYDNLMIDSSLKVSSKLFKRRHFAYPIKISGDTSVTKKAIEQVLSTSQLLMHGGQNFEIKVAHTESMSAKEAVKNIIQCLLTVTSLVIYTSKVKHNLIHEVYLSTSKSVPLPIITTVDE